MAKQYGRWEVKRSLSEGGQAHALVVTDTKDEKEGEFVLKRLKDINRVDRFRQEIETISRLAHRNVVPLIDYDIEGTKPYLVTPLYQRGTLSDLLGSRTVSPEEKLRVRSDFPDDTEQTIFRLFGEICEGVAHAHLNEVVHRDIKPDNVFVWEDENGDAQAIVGDFGICHVSRNEGRMTLTGDVMGARGFAAPELERGDRRAVGTPSDVYSLGMLLYWMLSGGKTIHREEYREEGVDLSYFIGDSRIEHISGIIDNSVATEPVDRYQNAIGLLRDFRSAVSLLHGQFNVPGTKAAQKCRYCGRGVYRSLGASLGASDMHAYFGNPGPGPVSGGAPDIRVLTCNQCGHTELFRLDILQDPTVWDDWDEQLPEHN